LKRRARSATVPLAMDRTLPEPDGPLFGHTTALAAYAAALAAGARVVTLTGPLGVGKSRVALEIGRQHDGPVCFAFASGAGSRAELVLRVAGALRLAASDDVDGAVSLALDERGVSLLVLDGVDRALGAARELAAAWLSTDEDRVVLITSRERLGLPSEHVVEIAPLGVPVGDALEGDAAAYFLRCARRVRTGFAPSPAETPFLAALVRELDGLPLALELAAPRLAVLAPAALLHRVRASRSLLSTRAAKADDAHRSFDAAMESSWQALRDHERTALAELSPFADDLAFDAAEAVISVVPGAPKTLETVQGLVDKSLLAAREGRLSLLRGIADFARRHVAPEVVTAAHDRHARLFGERARAACLSGLDVSADTAELLAVIERALGTVDLGARTATPALWATIALARARDGSGPAHSALLERVLEATQGSGVDPDLLARALGLRAASRRRRGDLAGATRDLGRAVPLARARGAALLEADLALETAALLADTGDLDAACAEAERAIALFQLHGGIHEAPAWLVLAELERARRGAAVARPFAERAVALAVAAGDHAQAARARVELGRVWLDLGDHEAFRALHATLRASSVPPRERARASALEALAAHDEGELRRAAAGYSEAAALARALGLADVEAAILELSALAHVAQGAHGEAHAELRLARAGAGRGVARIDALLDALAAIDGAPRSPPRADSLPRTPLLDLVSAVVARDVPRFERLSASLAADVHARVIARTFASALRAPSAAPPPPVEALSIGPEGRYFAVPGEEPVSLARRRPLAKILDVLADARRDRPGAPVSWTALLAAAWPGERVLESAGAHRVRVALSTLRKMGLRDHLMSSADGYWLDPARKVVRPDR
jgi:predicted ATPase